MREKSMANLNVCFFSDADHFSDTGTFTLGPEDLLVGVERAAVQGLGLGFQSC